MVYTLTPFETDLFLLVMFIWLAGLVYYIAIYV